MAQAISIKATKRREVKACRAKPVVITEKDETHVRVRKLATFEGMLDYTEIAISCLNERRKQETNIFGG